MALLMGKWSYNPTYRGCNPVYLVGAHLAAVKASKPLHLRQAAKRRFGETESWRMQNPTLAIVALNPFGELRQNPGSQWVNNLLGCPRKLVNG